MPVREASMRSKGPGMRDNALSWSRCLALSPPEAVTVPEQHGGEGET